VIFIPPYWANWGNDSAKISTSKIIFNPIAIWIISISKSLFRFHFAIYKSNNINKLLKNLLSFLKMKEGWALNN
jgi:hypothetical protein